MGQVVVGGACPNCSRRELSIEDVYSLRPRVVASARAWSANRAPVLSCASCEFHLIGRYGGVNTAVFVEGASDQEADVNVGA